MSAETLASNPLIFRWAPPRPRKRAIVSFLIASIMLHAVAFYIFQVVYPPAVALLPAPARVSVISPVTEDGRVLLRWIEAEDPALGSMTLRPPGVKTFQPPKIAHVPSFMTYEPKLRELPAYVPDLRAPDPLPPQPVPQRRPAAPQALPPSKTTVSFSRETDALGQLQTPEMQFTRSITDSPQAAEFRVAISRFGEVRYAFLQTSSGDTALDEQARRFLANCRFAGTSDSANDLIWTTAAIVWGSDIAASKAP